MCISASVGHLAVNRREDVKTVQALLNFSRRPPLSYLTEDGYIGSKTNAAIAHFTETEADLDSEAQVVPGGRVLNALKRHLPNGFWPGQLRMIAVAAPVDRVTRFFEPLSQCMTDFGITTPIRRAHFLAQVCHESGHLRYTEEIASGQAYEGRADLGNTQPGDGVRFKGRGLIQLTGRSNYEAYGRALGRDFTTDAGARTIATNPQLAAHVAGWFWNRRNLNTLADGDQLQTITRRVNGGLNGFADRQALYQRARCAFGL